MRHVFAFVIMFTTLSASILSAQSTVPLDKLLTPDQYRAAGLTKLSKSELDSLSRYVTDYSQSVARVVLEAAISSPRNRSGDVPGPSTSPASAGIVGEALESRIDGEFKGWDGETIFRFQNGQIWQQAAYAYTYHYAYAPRVLVYRSSGVYKMKVDGVEAALTVKRIK